MSGRVWALAVVLATGATARAQPERRWLRANFHAHAATTAEVRDDGTETPAALHQAVRAAGFDFSAHTPHCTGDTAAHAQEAAARYAALRAEEGKLHVPGLTIGVGEELTVAHGPNYADATTVLGRKAPGNLDHMTLLGNRAPYPFAALTPAAACDRVHADGGICIVNHPGPGPMMWEEGYWEAPKNRARVDGIEVYNGAALSAVGIDFESRYREATAYSGLGIKVAAVTGADTHGPRSVARNRARVMSVAGPAARLVRALLPKSPSARPELDAATLVLADGARVEDVIAAVKARRTVATWALPGLRVDVDGLGEVRRTRKVQLSLSASRKLDEVTLYREGVPVRTWRDADHVTWQETIDAPAAYVFGARDGRGRLLTSAIWYEPPKKK